MDLIKLNKKLVKEKEREVRIKQFKTSIGQKYKLFIIKDIAGRILIKNLEQIIK